MKFSFTASGGKFEGPRRTGFPTHDRQPCSEISRPEALSFRLLFTLDCTAHELGASIMI